MNMVPRVKAHEVAALATDLLGSTRFQHRYRPVRAPDRLLGWTVEDVANGGDDACASFISYVLKKSRLLQRTRSTVGMMIRDMEQSGWERTDEQALGGVAMWGFREDVKPDADREFGHSGLYVGNDTFISHSSYEFVPVRHQAQLRDGRLPLTFYSHEDLMGRLQPSLPIDLP